VVFVEDYDMNVARYLVQGVDVWLNTPRRPLEASGTSGMKAAANGVLNLSILDGWWCEGYEGDNGWVIGTGEEYSDADYQDQVESEALYEILEKDIVPSFYERSRDDIPREWIRKMKRCLITCSPEFNTNRMLRDYSENFYFPATDQFLRMSSEDYTLTRQVLGWEKRVFGSWSKVGIVDVQCDALDQVVHVGQEVPVHIEVSLGDLTPEDLRVEVFYGQLDSVGEILNSKTLKLEFTRKTGSGNATFSGIIRCLNSGRFGFVPRLMASNPDIPVQDRLKHITWG
jgi:starch phosphorylase